MNEHEINSSLRCEVQELTVQVAVLHSRLESSKEALGLQASEYERRLDVLNHAHEEAKDVLSKYGSTYMTIDRFDRFFNDFIEWRRSIDSSLSNIKAASLKYAAVIAAIFTSVTLILQLWHSWKG